MSKQARRPGRIRSTGRGHRGDNPSLPNGPVHRAKRPRACRQGTAPQGAGKGRKSLNEVLRDTLIREAEGTDVPERVYTDLDALVGSWVDVPGFDDAIEAQDRVEEALWR